MKITRSLVGIAAATSLLAGVPAFAANGKSNPAAKLAVSAGAAAQVVCEIDADGKARLHDTVADTWGKACKIKAAPRSGLSSVALVTAAAAAAGGLAIALSSGNSASP